MRRSKPGMFSTSFLDLLSGALAAVILLLVIVPKLTPRDAGMLEKIRAVEALAGDVDALVARLEESVPKTAIEEVGEELEALRSSIEALQRHVAELVREAHEAAEENASLRERAARQEEELARLRRQVEETTQRLREAEPNRSANTVEKTLGVFARFGILCRWSEPDADVDIGVQRFGTSPEQCWRMYPSKPWGILGEDVRERAAGDEERFELFYVPEIYPDVYTAWVNIYEGSTSRHARAGCTLIFHPGRPDKRRHEIGPIVLDGHGLRCFVTFRLTDYGFELLPHREPLWGEGRVIK